MQTNAVVLNAPKTLSLETVELTKPGAEDLVVEIAHSGISTGTEKLFWSGDMPPFPGVGYPLIPGYEASGEVVEAGPNSRYKVGDHVFVPGANCYDGVFGLFGGATKRLVTDQERVTRIDPAHGAAGALLALAATAPAPTVWEIDADRAAGATGYEVIHPDKDERRDYKSIYDASGNGNLLNDLIGRIQKGGEIVLAGFYTQPLQFSFPPAFMKEARFRVAAEWAREDLTATRTLVENGALSLDGLITHQAAASDAPGAYRTACEDPSCLKMILDWKGVA